MEYCSISASLGVGFALSRPRFPPTSFSHERLSRVMSPLRVISEHRELVLRVPVKAGDVASGVRAGDSWGAAG